MSEDQRLMILIRYGNRHETSFGYWFLQKTTTQKNPNPSDSHTLRFSIKYGHFSSLEEAIKHILAAKLTQPCQNLHIFLCRNAFFMKVPKKNLAWSFG